MADRFVSAGTAEEPPERDDDWLAAQREVDAAALRRKEQAAAGSGLQEGGKSLFEVLQANKAAKQDAFEEAAKLKHQFRSLDDDEIDFLDSVMESTRKKELEVKKETSEQLDLFRRQREEAARITREAEGAADEAVDADVSWKVGSKKRKKGKEMEVVKGLKLRKMSSHADGVEVKDASPAISKSPAPVGASSPVAAKAASITQRTSPKRETAELPSASAAGPALVDYSSDDD